MADSDLQKRVQRIRRYVLGNFETQAAFCEATGMASSTVSRALDPKAASDRRVAHVEAAIFRLQEAGALAEAGDETLDELEEIAERIRALVREARELRGK